MKTTDTKTFIKYFAWLPALHLTPYASLLLADIYTFTEKDGKCYRSLTGFSQATGATRQTVVASLEMLIAAGLISKTVKKGCGAVYVADEAGINAALTLVDEAGPEALPWFKPSKKLVKKLDQSESSELVKKIDQTGQKNRPLQVKKLDSKEIEEKEDSVAIQANSSNSVFPDPIHEENKPAGSPGKKARAKVFSRPTVEEVAEYCRNRGNTVNAQHFVDYYDSVGWVVGKSPMKDWQAAVRTWEARERPHTPAPVQTKMNKIITTKDFINSYETAR